MDNNNSSWIGRSNSLDELSLTAGKIEVWTVRALQFPFVVEPNDKDCSFRSSRQVYGVCDCLVWINLLCTTETLFELTW